MFKEKRNYTRTPLQGVDANIYINGKEITATIKDISETGIAFTIMHYAPIRAGDIIRFQFLDSVSKEHLVIDGRATVVRTNMEKNCLIIGCRIPLEKNYSNYVREKEALRFFSEPLRQKFAKK